MLIKNRVPTPLSEDALNRFELENNVIILQGIADVPCIKIASIAQPWRDQFLNYLSGGLSSSADHMTSCLKSMWDVWLHQQADVPAPLRPQGLTQAPYTWGELRTAMQVGKLAAQGLVVTQAIKAGRDAAEVIELAALRAGYTSSELTLQKAFFRGVTIELQTQVATV
jgi:hypothetical protein